MDSVSDSTERNLTPSSLIQDKEQIMGAYKDIQAILTNPIDEIGMKKVKSFIDSINTIMLAASTNIEQLMKEDVKLEQQLNIIKTEDDNEDIDYELEVYKKHFNQNFFELKENIMQAIDISLLNTENATDKTIEVVYKSTYRVKIEFEEEGWEKLIGVQLISHPEAMNDKFLECVQGCIHDDDLLPLWNYMYKNFR